MIDDVIKDSDVLADVINTDLAEVNDVSTVSISSTLKRHIRNKRKAVDTTQMGPKPKAPTAGSSSMPTSVPEKTAHRLSQLQQKKRQYIRSNLKDSAREPDYCSYYGQQYV